MSAHHDASSPLLRRLNLVGLLLLGLLVLAPLVVDLHPHDAAAEAATKTAALEAANPDAPMPTLEDEAALERAAESSAHRDASHDGHGGHGVPPLWQLGTVPFVLLLLAIAILPLVRLTMHWWESNTSRLAVSLGLAGLTLVYYAVFDSPTAALLAVEHAIPGEYVPFIMLLFSLYVISGGISITGDLRATPTVNTAFIAVGTAIASFVGTTGASMLLIRPLLETNRERKHRVHTVVFFIFLVSNIGGTLLPIGDPPLFLGYLRGVPFTWTLVLWKEWAVLAVVLLVVYWIWDSIMVRRETVEDIKHDVEERRPLRLQGVVNLVLLTGVVFAVAFLDPSKPIPGTEFHAFPFMRELVMLGLAGASLAMTPAGIREANRFNYHAIVEVAALFVGIFITMQVPLAVLKANGASLGLESPGQFFWLTGLLSSFLDNAPTYLVFFQTAESLTTEPGDGILTLMGGEFIRQDLLVGISLGAVFMGANTYIGNGPNFMVKSIAEQGGVRMPSFFGYMLYSLLVLVPCFVLVHLLFL
jgi:Na+/H+ antiporter NhaD/arsenite permease-like protein